MSYWDDGEGSADEWYDNYSDELGLGGDEYASDLLGLGWGAFDEDTEEAMLDEYGFFDSAEAREAFFEYMDMDPSEFDWEGWREYMGYD